MLLDIDVCFSFKLQLRLTFYFPLYSNKIALQIRWLPGGLNCRTKNKSVKNPDRNEICSLHRLFLVELYLRNMLFICLRMKALSPRNFPYMRWRTVLRKSLSRGSSESNNSNNCRTNFWSITRFPMAGWKSELSKNLRKNSYTSWRCGQLASSVGSSSSGSKSGFSLGGSVRKRLAEIWQQKNVLEEKTEKKTTKSLLAHVTTALSPSFNRFN